MKKVFFTIIVLFLTLNIVAQENEKPYVEIETKFSPVDAVIKKIEVDEKYTILFLDEDGKFHELKFPNTTLNKSFLSYVKVDDIINLKVVNNENRIAIIRHQETSVLVKIYFVR